MLNTINSSIIVGGATIPVPSCPSEQLAQEQRAACEATLAALRVARKESESLLNAEYKGQGPHPMTNGIDRLIAHCEEGIAQYNARLNNPEMYNLPF